ncbi:MAG: hypothetical protein HIU92_02320 [Proteobacteria bacterium]|nr:hypothetical protein [Pseudomonadota bacterium]
MKLSASSLPDAVLFDGRDILTDHERPNYVRNFREPMSFAATTGLLASAIGAFIFGMQQLS